MDPLTFALAITASGIVSAIILLVLIVVIAHIIFTLGRMFFGLIVNSALGLITIYVLNTSLGLGISLGWISWILIAIFGLPAVLIVVLLKLLGI